jgi:hypothetical protein
MATKSNNQKRGGKRPGAGRPRGSVGSDEARIGSSRQIDWDAIGRTYFTGTCSVEDVCASFGVSYGDLLAYATDHGWIHRPPKPHPGDLGELASALALTMFSVDGVANRARRFVAAMVILGAPPSDIAEVLHISKPALQAEFSKELAGARG